MSGRIIGVDPHSPADKAGLKPGQVLISANGHEIRDVLDYKFHTYEPRIELLLEDKDGKSFNVKVRKKEGEDLGLDFENYLMDDMRSCVNKCIFCFVDQMPAGLRESLYVKDDDSRLSFLLGNYVTLTNLTAAEFERIIDMKISPLCVSVHATEPELRAKMLGIPGAARCYEQLKRLAAAGIELHCQIVVCPGYNDKEHLERTLSDLMALDDMVTSISVIPVGLTRHRCGLSHLEPVTPFRAAECIDICETFAQKNLEQRGMRVVYCSDEMYLRAGRELPGYEYYEEFEQLENGVGMLRLLEYEFSQAVKLADDGIEPSAFAIATGCAAAPYIEHLLEMAKEKYPAIEGRVYAVRNDFFGEGVDVAGLITGTDLIARLSTQKLPERLLLPQVMLRSGEDVFLDGVSVGEVEERLGVEICTVPNDGFELLDRILEV